MYYLVEQVACAIAKSRGHDPRQMVVPGQPYLIDGKTFAATSAYNEPVPLWTLYQTEAKAAIDAMAGSLQASLG